MRKSFMFIFGLAAFALAPHEAMGEVKLTAQQVETVCGKTPGNIGCSKKCGLNNEHTCDFGCNPPDQCRGLCTTCGVKERRIFLNRYSNRVTRASLALPVRAGYRARRPTYCEWCYASCPQGWGGWLCRVHCQSRGGCKPPVLTHP